MLVNLLKVVAVILFLDKGFPKGGGGEGSDVWEKFPNNIVFFFESVPYHFSITILQ